MVIRKPLELPPGVARRLPSAVNAFTDSTLNPVSHTN
jgi:hypothetical protein